MKLISIVNSSLNHAGSKAPADIINILKDEYKENVSLETLDLALNNSKSKLVSKTENFLLKIKFLSKLFFDKQLKVIQYPIKPIQLLRFFPGNKTIVLIHDLVGLRYLNSKDEKKEIKYLSKFKYIIAHNEHMKKYLIDKGISSDKIYVLELFDYLVDNNVNVTNRNSELILDYVGNLVELKCPFIYELGNSHNFLMNLYGNGLEKEIHNTKYMGSFKPDELPNKLQGNYGLVWDGKCDESDEESMYKNYTKYNNPHKLSCYMAAGLPVIVWRKSAVADFVKKYNVGYIINSLDEIDSINTNDYNEKKKNVQAIRNNVINGYYTRRVFKSILENNKNK